MTTDDQGDQAGWPRRDVLKAIAMLAATPLAAQARRRGADSGRSVWRGRRGRQARSAVRRRVAFPARRRPRRRTARRSTTRHGARSTCRTTSASRTCRPAPPTRTGKGPCGERPWLPSGSVRSTPNSSAGGRDTGWFVGGTGWYRKRFSAAAVPADGQVEIVFDGVYMNSDVWLNGTLLGNHPYGYTAFAYDLTPHLRRAGENVLAVRVRNEGRNSRWYSGSGIYRHVWLNATGSVRVPLWGVFVTTPEVSKDKAAVKVAVQIENRAPSAQDVTVRMRLFDPNGRTRRHAGRPPIARRPAPAPTWSRYSPWPRRSCGPWTRPDSIAPRWNFWRVAGPRTPLARRSASGSSKWTRNAACASTASRSS